MLPAMRRFTTLATRVTRTSMSVTRPVCASQLPLRPQSVRCFASHFEPLKIPSPVLYGTGGQAAQGLFDAISEKYGKNANDFHKQLTQAQEDLQQIAARYPEQIVQAALTIGTEAQKKQTLEQLTKTASPFAKTLVFDLFESNKLHHIQRAADSFAQLVKFEKKQIWFNVKSAVELTKDQLNRVTSALRTHVVQGANVVVNTQVDPSILGGLIVEADGNVLDISAARIIGEFEQQIKQQQA